MVNDEEDDEEDDEEGDEKAIKKDDEEDARLFAILASFAFLRRSPAKS